MKGIFSLKFVSILLIINGLSLPLIAQIGYQIVGGASHLSMGGASVSFQGAQAIFHNPAGLVGTTQSTALLTSEIKMGLTDLKPIGCAYISPTSSGVFGFSFQNYSFETYRENKLGIAYARRLSSKFNIGIQLDYLRLKVGEYGTANILTFEIGCNTFITNDLVLSAYVFNPVAAPLNEAERTPSVFRLGLGYNLNSKVLICLETEKDIDFPASFKFGLAYKPVETLTLRCGFRTAPSMFSFGLGYTIKKQFIVDLALANHPYLGMTPALSLNYVFNK
jgi:hypothetical protein